MGGAAFAVVLTGSANNPTRPRGRAVISVVQSTSSTSANVTFTYPNVPPCNGGSLVAPGNGFISYTAIANTGQTGVIAVNSGNKIDVNGLAANTVYKFQVFATNEFGSSDRSACSAAITMQTIAEAPVIGAITTTCCSATVPITMPTFTGGNTITSTTVSVSPGGTPFTNPGNAPFTAPFSGLSPLTAYTFTASSTTPIGTGRSSSRGATTKGPVTVNYMVVAGGGGGGRSALNAPQGGGQIGGGGGGGGGVIRGSFVKAPGSVLTFTVGTGGAGGVTTAPSAGAGTNGLNSTLTCATTAIGGGGGAGSSPLQPFGSSTASPGGNGGGGATRYVNSTFPNTQGFTTGPGGTGSQGFGGGSGNGGAGGPPFPAAINGGGGGGGGGAGAGGGNGVSGPNIAFSPLRTGAGGPGGAGYTWPFTGLVYGSGGGGAQVTTPTSGPAAPGGGTPFGLGGTGGGPVNASSNGGAGSSGVVMLAIPTPQYPGIAPGATVTTPASAPGMTVLQYPAPGTYTV